MAIRGLGKLKTKKNDAEVSQNEDIVTITFDEPIKVDGSDVREFKMKVPTLSDMEIASSGMTDANSIVLINKLLSNMLTPKIAPADFDTVFTLKEHSVLSEVIGSFL